MLPVRKENKVNQVIITDCHDCNESHKDFIDYDPFIIRKCTHDGLKKSKRIPWKGWRSGLCLLPIPDWCPKIAKSNLAPCGSPKATCTACFTIEDIERDEA